MRKAGYFLLGILILSIPASQPADPGFDNFSGKFVQGYRQLDIPPLQLGYIENLSSISSGHTLQSQFDFFTGIEKELKQFHVASLDEKQKIDFDLITFETKLNLERISLEKITGPLQKEMIGDNGLYTMPHGKEWYRYFLKRWTASEADPDSLFAFGLRELADVQIQIEKIRLKTGMDEQHFYGHLRDDSFYIHHESEVKATFEKTKATVLANVEKQFYPVNIPGLNIRRGGNTALVQTPGYYSDNTFFYNYFDAPYNRRQVDWLFIHEAIPGHHYQSSIAAGTDLSQVQKLFYYLAFSEGWAAYTETLGKEIGLYHDIYDELGKWEWDIVRSARVPMDIGLNYYGWSDEQALAFWKKNIRNQDEIAMREIHRLRRWPAQAISYKYGAARILAWKKKKMNAPDFNIREFHQEVLQHGALPFFILEKILFKK